MQLKSKDGTIHQLSFPNIAPRLRVFNSDFVSENLRFADGSSTPILVVGADDISKQKSLEEKNKELGKLTNSRQTKQLAKEEKITAIGKELSRCARDLIKIPLSFPNYEKPNFEAKVDECKISPESYLLDDEILAQCLLIYRSTDKKPTLSIKMLSFSSITQLREKAVSLLARTVTANSPIPRLKDNPAVESWVKQGRPLHDGVDTCQFCGQTLPADLLSHLIGHFSADYDDLMVALGDLAQVIQTAEEEEIPLDHKADFYPELSDRFTTKKQGLDALLTIRKTALISLGNALSQKQKKAFTGLECPSVGDPGDQIVSVVEDINQIILEHNNRTSEFDQRRKEAFRKVEKHYAASFVRDQKYNEELQEIANLKNSIIQEGLRIEELTNDIRDLEMQLSEASKGAERINQLLGAYFGKGDLRVEVSVDNRFQISRGGGVAKNLSEGEKTAIAFAHFITSIQDGRYPLKDTIVVIDDPISSLDACHLFNTYALIKTQMADCRQLFISTHSFEFYNLIREWVSDAEDIKKPQATWKKWGVFLVKRSDDGTAALEEIPKELLRFKSEYHYLFSTLYQFDKAESADFDCLLSLPNVVRRFMEAFGGIMIPLSTGLKGKMARLFPDEVERECVWKFINHYSHNTTITRSLTIPDTSECKSVVSFCLKAVRNWNPTYMADLEKEVIT